MTRLYQALIVALGVALGLACAQGPASSTARPGAMIITRPLIVRDLHRYCTNRFEVDSSDPAGMLWTNCDGTWSGGEPFIVWGVDGKPKATLGGPLGSYGGQSSLTLYLGGQPVTLTAARLARLLCLVNGPAWHPRMCRALIARSGQP